MNEDAATEIPWYEMPHGMDRELAKYDQCEEPGYCDHDHDSAIEHLRETELDELRDRAEKAEAILARVTSRMTEYHQHGSGMVNVRQVINLLSPTWPDGNYCNEEPS